MDSRYLILVLSASILRVNSQPIIATETASPNIVPGVFISADTLRELQEKAQQNQINPKPPLTNEPSQPITYSESRPALPPNTNEQNLQISSSVPSNAPSQNAPIPPQAVISQPILSNQPVANPQISQNQPQYIPQQQVVPNQPSQLYLLAPQPNQPLQQQPLSQYQQPGNQLYLSQPGNQLYVSQPSNQLTQQPSQQVLLQNGQYAQLSQPYTSQAFTNPSNQGVVSNPGSTIYAMVPVNGNSFGQPSSNLGSGNVYFIPPQQQTPLTNQVYTVNGK